MRIVATTQNRSYRLLKLRQSSSADSTLIPTLSLAFLVGGKVDGSTEDGTQVPYLGRT